MTNKYLLSAFSLLAAVSLAACGQKTPPTSENPDVQAQIEQNDEMKAKEEELARREAELALKEKEAELARREADLAKATSKPKSSSSSGGSSHASSNSGSSSASTPKPAGPRQYTVAQGTSISVQLPAAISTKTAKVGDRVSANLTSDIVVDGRTIAKAGGLLQGQVTEVVSGSNKIGGTPMISLAFDNLTLADGSDAPVAGHLSQVSEKSDTARDTAKIAGGTVAGAIIGHKVVKGDKGTVIGGLLGAAVGTIAAKETGTEVVLPAGTVLGFTLDQPMNVTM